MCHQSYRRQGCKRRRQDHQVESSWNHRSILDYKKGGLLYTSDINSVKVVGCSMFGHPNVGILEGGRE